MYYVNPCISTQSANNKLSCILTRSLMQFKCLQALILVERKHLHFISLDVEQIILKFSILF